MDAFQQTNQAAFVIYSKTSAQIIIKKTYKRF